MGAFFAVDSLLQGLASVFHWQQLMWLCIGVFLGLVGGTLPGISGATMLSIMLVFVSKFPLDCMVIAMAGIYAASTYSGSTAGILYNVPGDAPGIPTTIEGYAMTKKGKSLSALTAALSASFYGATLSFVLMMIMVPIFLYLVNFIGSGERALFALWALVIITGGALTREDSIRGLASMAVGLFLGTVGMQRNLGAIRFVENQTALWDGLDLLWIILGIFAIPQLIKLPYIKVLRQERISINPLAFYKDCFVMMRDKWRLMSKAAVLGTIIGVIPGIGAVTASWVGYSTAEKSSKEPEPFGKGNIDGIIGAESANNAAVPGTFVPLLALGIPGSAANAIILGAFIAAGIYPGPALMLNNGPVVWTILFGIGLSGVVFLLLGVPFIKMAQMMVILPNEFLIAFIGILSLLGTYLAKYSVFGALITILIGLVVMAGSRFGLIASSVLLGYILGPTIEVEFIRAYQIGGFSRFLQPISLVLLVLILITLSWGFVQNYLRQRQADKRVLSEKEKIEKEYLEQLDDESVDTGSHLGDLVFGVLGVSLAAYILISMWNITFLARFWPMLVAVFFLGIPSIVLIGRSFFRIKAIRQSVQNMRASATGSLLSKNTLDFIVIIGGLTLSTVLIDDLGFTGASALFALIVIGFFSRKPTRTIAGVLAFTAAMWFMRVSMGFSLPTGILGL
jgi:putative tricarboxylic transport membrane protein